MKSRHSFADVTAIIKTFLRDEYFFECVRSLRSAYPDITIIAADSGYPSEEKRRFAKEQGIEYHEMPFDAGICKGRNFLVEKVKTPLVLIGDDDFFYTPETNIEAMLAVLDDSGADIVGGLVKEGGKVREYQGDMTFDGDTLRYTGIPAQAANMRTERGFRWASADITFNFAIIRRHVFERALWDPRIKVAYEHSDFFLTAKDEGFRTAFTPDTVVVHKPGHVRPDETEYKPFRHRRSDREYFFRKWGVRRAIDMSGNEDRLHNDLSL